MSPGYVSYSSRGRRRVAGAILLGLVARRRGPSRPRFRSRRRPDAEPAAECRARPRISSPGVKLARLETVTCDAGWRPWLFVKATTDDGLVGWSEVTDSHGSPTGVASVVADLAPLVAGKDPRPWVDDVPRREELTTAVPEIVGGELRVPGGPGWGVELNEDVLLAHPWQP